MQNAANNNQNHDGSSNGGYPLTKLTAKEITWWFRHHDELLGYIKSKGNDITDDNARAILDKQFNTLSEKGFEYIYIKDNRDKIRNGEITPTDKQKLTYIKRHLKQRICDFFRGQKAEKRGYGQVSRLDDPKFTQLEDLNSRDPYESCEANELRYRAIHLAKKLLHPKNLSKFNDRELIVISVSRREGLTQLKAKELYALILPEERSKFLREDGKPVHDEERSIKKAIYKTIKQLPVTTAKILSSDLED